MNQNFLWICTSTHYVLHNYKVSRNSVEWFQRSCANKNKRPMGHIVHLRKQFKLINTSMQSYNYTIPLIKRKNSKSPLWKLQWSFISKIESTSPKDASCQVWLKLAQWFCRKIFKYFVNEFSLFLYYLPFERCVALHLNKLESPLPKDALCQVWLKLTHWFWRR